MSYVVHDRQVLELDFNSGETIFTQGCINLQKFVNAWSLVRELITDDYLFHSVVYLLHVKIRDAHANVYNVYTLMGEGFILLTRGYGFMGGGVPPPFDTLKKCTSAYDMNLKLYR